jgi:hypothetical protein
MARHASNSERIAKKAAEAAATAKEKAEKKAAAAAKPKRTPKAREPKPPVRMKIVWSVGEPGSANQKIFAYPDRAAADAEAARMGRNSFVRALKVPME